MEPMSNFELSISAYTKETLTRSLEIIFMHSKVYGWKTSVGEDGRRFIHLYDSSYGVTKDRNATPLPTPMIVSFAVEMVWAWIQDEEPLEEPNQGPDGSESKGYHIKCKNMSWNDPTCTIHTIWAWHAK